VRPKYRVVRVIKRLQGQIQHYERLMARQRKGSKVWFGLKSSVETINWMILLLRAEIR
jgi:hypothetical protein